MIVCLCEGLSERVIQAAVREGASSVREVARATRAGTHCGSCVCDVRQIVRRCRDAAPEAPLAAK